MRIRKFTNYSTVILAMAILSACSNRPTSLGSFGSGLFGSGPEIRTVDDAMPPELALAGSPPPIRVLQEAGRTRFTLFGQNRSAEAVAGPNPALVNAALEVLNFLPVTSLDRANGSFATGYGTPPGGTQAYRAVVQVTGATLELSSIHVELTTRSDAVDRSTEIAIERAILSRALQLTQNSR